MEVGLPSASHSPSKPLQQVTKPASHVAVRYGVTSQAEESHHSPGWVGPVARPRLVAACPPDYRFSGRAIGAKDIVVLDESKEGEGAEERRGGGGGIQ